MQLVKSLSGISYIELKSVDVLSFDLYDYMHISYLEHLLVDVDHACLTQWWVYQGVLLSENLLPLLVLHGDCSL